MVRVHQGALNDPQKPTICRNRGLSETLGATLALLARVAPFPTSEGSATPPKHSIQASGAIFGNLVMKGAQLPIHSRILKIVKKKNDELG
jgi:hypothetical protein